MLMRVASQLIRESTVGFNPRAWKDHVRIHVGRTKVASTPISIKEQVLIMPGIRRTKGVMIAVGWAVSDPKAASDVANLAQSGTNVAIATSP
ncbi:hypothetical protein [Aureimonas phyllosphaerae]|uniref:Uncharacterized protein n=1 Tax=Aureimonas phyllosphaerae TaxID=1166078 RepID=A0A7W6BSS7_9HYPH|nr:hypothetical protein [Aureimonas phyllosphaerae]MBB3937358.1 hypothetical protein [Aureimonas phyllosphaerae]MBB3961365.1 hypothetical protein [Aureimonas phyllosphaerae]